MKYESIKKFIKKNIVVVISILFGVAAAAFSLVYVNINRCEECEKCEETFTNNFVTSEEKEKYILIDVKGAVKKSGVYSLKDGSTVNDAIELAGGITSNGTTENINLSKRIKDEMVIYVFTKSELKNKDASKTIACEIPKCECETIVVDREICTNNDTNNVVDDIISINNASVEELMKLDGIGESKAKAIVEYRNTNGAFSKIEDIMNVSGIGQKAFDAIKDKITV